MEADYDSILQATRENKPSEFQAHVNDILGQKIMDALDRRRQEMAQSIFAEPAEEEPVVDADETESEINNDETSSEIDSEEDVDDTQIEEPNGQDA